MRKLTVKTIETPIAQGFSIAEFMQEACFSGERIVLKGQDDSCAALVPLEDLEILELLEEEI